MAEQAAARTRARPGRLGEGPRAGRQAIGHPRKGHRDGRPPEPCRGSLGKGTSNAPVKDLDLYLTLDAGVWGDADDPPNAKKLLDDFVERLRHALRWHYDRGILRVERQRHSVGVVYLAEGSANIDVVPMLAVPRQPGLCQIPRRTDGAYVQTSVLRQLALIEHLDGGRRYLRDGVRLLKLWSGPREPRLRSYALKILAMHAVQTGCERSAAGLFWSVLDQLVGGDLKARSSPEGRAFRSPPTAGWDEAVDWTVDGVASLADGGADLLSDLPLLGATAARTASVTKFAWETLGGFAKGAGDMVGGMGTMVAHPIDTARGIGTMLEHIPGSPLKPLQKLYDVATTDLTLAETLLRNPVDVAKEDLSTDLDFWKGVGSALLDPYVRSIEQGKYGEAIGRGIFDIGSMFVGAGELKALGKGAEVGDIVQHASVLNKMDEPVKVASAVDEVGVVTDDLVGAAGEVDELTRVADHADEAADLAKADDASKVADQVDEAALPPASKTEPVNPTTEAETTPGPQTMVTEAEETQQVAARVDEAPPASADLVADLAFQLDPKKYDYFFGRVERPPETLKATDPKQYEKLMHNYHRSQQLKGIFEGMGFADSPEGRNAIESLFQEGTSAPVVAEHKGAYGTTVTRAIERDGVILEIKYFYEGGHMTTKPKVVTVIPKVKK